MNTRSRLTSATLGAVLASCCPAKPAPPEPPATTASATAAPNAAALPTPSPKKPRVVVVFVVDQLASWVLNKYLPHLPEDGILKRAVSSGVHADVAYAYASTRTAPGHAATMTGQPPSVTGVTSNRVVLPEGGHRSFVDDGKHAVHGRDDMFAAPGALRAPTVGDALHDATGGRAKVLSVSGKDRAAVISGGKHADLALWYDYKIPGFTTSTYYAEAMPAPIASWLSAHPVSGLLVPWTADPASVSWYAALGPDDGPGEGDWLGFGTMFPHDPNASSAPYSVLRLTPQLTEMVLDVAAVAADHLELGSDDVVDLLSVSISGTDYVGHSLGPMSWEYADHLVRADRAMAKLVRKLEARGPVSVLITADHGVAPLPEKSDKPATRLFPDAIKTVAQSVIEDDKGEGQWVEEFSAPFLYLASGIAEDKALLNRVIEELEKVEGIHGAYDMELVKTWHTHPDRVKRSVALSVADDTPGALYLLPAEGCIFDEDRPHGKGTTHGTPWKHDTDVPAIFFGPDVETKRIDEVLPQNRVAPTIAALLGIKPPKGVTAQAIR